jgi:hypothetical protein
MKKVVFSLGLITGFAMFVVALIGPSSTTGVAAQESVAQGARTMANGCSVEELALDEGYGVSRKVVTRKCAAAD